MKKLGWLLSICALLMICISFVSVSIHYLFNIVSIPIQEIITYLHSTIFMLGIVFAYHYDKHVRIDIFYQNYNQKKRERINRIGTLLLLIPFFIFILYASFEYVMSSWSILEQSPETGGLPIVYLFKSLILLMPVSMIVYSVIKMLRKN